MTRHSLAVLAAALMTLSAFSGTIRILTLEPGPIQAV